MMRIFSLLAILASISNAQSCCSTCSNNPAGSTFACPTLNGVSGCQITVTNGVASCVCSANSATCQTSVATCNSASNCPSTTSSSATTSPAGGSSVAVSVQVFSDNNCQTLASNGAGTVTIASGANCGTIAISGSASLTGSASISGNTITLQACTCASSTQCGTTSAPAVSFTNGACNPASAFVVGGTGSVKLSWSSGNPCFHTDTIITYAGKEHTFDEIRAHPECSIPHVVHTHGVIVTAKCGADEKTLKLTDGHLVYTQRGLQAAGDLKPGQDTVYADIAETTKCQVVSVTKETKQHDYFGLNCLNSQVLASGLKSSTFEKLHSVPAFWMQVMGRVLGIKRASQLGDYIAELVQKMNLI